jgi:hypothetical protein
MSQPVNQQEQPDPTPQQALDVIINVISQHRAVPAEHIAIGKCIGVLKELIDGGNVVQLAKK